MLILAHGSSDDGLCWTNLAKEFQKDFDIVMFAGLIKELKLNKPILMGHSMGS